MIGMDWNSSAPSTAPLVCADSCSPEQCGDFTPLSALLLPIQLSVSHCSSAESSQRSSQWDDFVYLYCFSYYHYLLFVFLSCCIPNVIQTHSPEGLQISCYVRTCLLVMVWKLLSEASQCCSQPLHMKIINAIW